MQHYYLPSAARKPLTKIGARLETGGGIWEIEGGRLEIEIGSQYLNERSRGGA